MKLNKIYSLLCGVAVLAAFASCSDEVMYSPAKQTPGVFFPASSPTKYTLSADGTSFDVTLSRAGSLAAATVALTNNFEPNTFTMPASVAFAEGEESATLTISYDGATLAPGKYDLEIGFASGTAVSEYGLAVLSLTVTMPEPVLVLPWNDLGECTFTDPFITAGFFGFGNKAVSYKVHIEESGDTPGFYRVVAPYGSAFAAAFKAAYFDLDEEECLYDANDEYYLEIHAEDPAKVYILPQRVHVQLNPAYGMPLGMSDAGYYYAFDEENLEDAVYGVMKDGIITLPLKNALVAYTQSTDPDLNPTLIWYGNTKSSIKLVVMPGVQAGDFSAEVGFLGQFNNVATGLISAVAQMEFGADVASAKAGIINSSDATSLVAGIKAGTYEAVTVDLNDPVVTLPVYTSGTYTIAVVTYDENGEPQDSGDTTFDIEVFANDGAAWNDLGAAVVADGWIVGGFTTYDPIDYAYEVEAQESAYVPGLYRFKNVWGAGTPLGNMSTTPENTCLYVNASDPEFIVITPQFTGWTYGNYGSVYAFNWEGYVYDLGYDKAFAVEKGYITTSIEDGMIAVEEPCICGTGRAFASGWGPYSAGEVSFILLPEAEEQPEAGVAARIAKAHKAPAKTAPKLNAGKQFKSSFKLQYNGLGNTKGDVTMRPGTQAAK